MVQLPHLHHLHTPVPDLPSPGLMYLKTGWVEQSKAWRVWCGAGRGAAPATKPQPAASYAKDGIFSQWGRPAPAPPAPLPPIRQVQPPQPHLPSRCQSHAGVTLEGMVDSDLSMQGVEKVKRRGDVWVPPSAGLGGWGEYRAVQTRRLPASKPSMLYSPLRHYAASPPHHPCHHPPPPPKLQLHPKICHCNT